MPSGPTPVAAVLATILVVASCGDPGDGKKARGAAPTTAGGVCGRVVTEPLDPRSTQHLLPGAPAPRYAGDPPTSGPHLSGVTLSGNQTQPIDGPAQVGVLEEGGVIVQYRPGLPAQDSARLTELGADEVVVAPNPTLPHPVVATAWRHRLTCRSVDLAALRAFISARAGKGPA